MSSIAPTILQPPWFEMQQPYPAMLDTFPLVGEEEGIFVVACKLQVTHTLKRLVTM